VGPVLSVVELQSLWIATECVGENDVRARIHEALVKPCDLVRSIDVPEFGRVAGSQARLEVVGPRGAVRQECPLGCEEIGKRGTHPEMISQIAPGWRERII